MVDARTPGSFGLATGVGLVASSMIGVGVLVSAGWAARVLGPGEILMTWVVGGVLAMAGARTYAALVQTIPRSGGEYRFLHELLHPAAGSLAGWTSLILGFSAPVAFSAAMAEAYAGTLLPLPPRLCGALLILAVTALAARAPRAARRTQDALAGAKVLSLAGFVALGLWSGSRHWPAWHPADSGAAAPVRGFPLQDFLGQLLWVAVAYSGWNTAVYAAEEFRDPRRSVPRAMLLGTFAVAILYLVVNWVFVANLDAARLSAWREAGGDAARTTLAHLIVRDLAGPTGASAMSLFVVLAMVSSISAMTLAGPRVFAAMARDGFAPRLFASAAPATPTAPTSIGTAAFAPSTWLQGALALVLFWTHSFDLLVENVGAVLTFTTALTALAALRARLWPPHGLDTSALTPFACACAALYALGSGYTLVVAAAQRPMRLTWIALLLAGSFLAWLVGPRAARGRPGAAP